MEKQIQNPFSEYQEDFRLFNARRGVNTATQDYYEEYMKRFFAYTGATLADFQAKKSLIKKYEVLYQIESIKNETRKKHLKALRIFSDFLEEAEKIETNEARKIKPPRVVAPLPKPLEDSEIQAIFQAIYSRYTDYLARRNILIIKTFLNTGVRLSELIELKKEDVQDNRIYIRNGKGGKSRIIYVNTIFYQELQEYIRVIQSDYIFTSQSGKKLGKTGLKRLFENIKKYTNNPSIHAHRLRHTYATKLIEKGVDIGIIKEQMGHADISTTNKYIAVRNEHRARVMEVVDLF